MVRALLLSMLDGVVFGAGLCVTVVLALSLADALA